jgi:hypothetical protein
MKIKARWNDTKQRRLKRKEEMIKVWRRILSSLFQFGVRLDIFSVVANSMEHSPFFRIWLYTSQSIIPRLLWTPKVYYRIHNSPLTALNQCQINPVHTLHPSSLTSIYILSSHLRLGLPSCIFLSGYVLFWISSMRATYTAQHILLDLIVLIIFSKTFLSWVV